MEALADHPDLGLEDVDFGPNPLTMVALCQLDPAELVEAANAEAVGLWHELAAFCLAQAASHAAALTDQHGGVSDPAAQADAQRAADISAAEAQTDPAVRALELSLAQGDGRDPAREFPEWEKDVLATRLGVSVGQAKRLCRTSVALRDRLPLTARALAAGAISWAHADRVAEHTRDLDADQCGMVERRVLADKRAVTPRQYENRTKKLASAYAPSHTGDEPGPERSLVAEELRDGGVAMHLLLDGEGGRTVATALDSLAGPTGPDDTRLVQERRADALVEVCAWWLDRGTSSPALNGTRPHLSLVTTAEVLAGVSELTGALAGVGGLPAVEINAEAVRRLGCDAGISVLSHDRGRIVDLGREARVPTAALRRRLEARDTGCRFPTCDRPATRCHAHHVRPWAAGGETSEVNMILTCHRHHRAVHEGGWTLTFDGITASWTDPHGRSYDGPAPLAEPPRWADDGPFFQPYRPPRSPHANGTRTGEPTARLAVPQANPPVSFDGQSDRPPF